MYRDPVCNAKIFGKCIFYLYPDAIGILVVLQFETGNVIFVVQAIGRIITVFYFILF